jgi:hypothetical protein
MLPTNLSTNEVKDAAGAELEFVRWAALDRKLVFASSGETEALPHRLTVNHQETGTGTDKVRRSVVRVDKSFTGPSGKQRKVSAYVVGVVPIGDQTDDTETEMVLANLISFVASKGASTTILYDTSGYGAECLRSGSL